MTTDTPHRLKHRLEYALFCFWGAVFTVLPYRAALALGWGVAWLGHYLFRYRVSLVQGRIREVFPTLPPREVRRIAWLSWRNLVFSLVDTFRLRKVDEAWLRRHVADYVQTAARLRERLSQPGVGAVGVSIHMGSVEVAARCTQLNGGDVFVIVKTQKNRLVDEKLNAMRSSTGIACIHKGSGMFKQVFRRLKAGGVLTMLNDLRMPEGGIVVDFLGHKASVAAGMALFAKRTGVPAIPSVITREGWTTHRLQMYPALYPDETLAFDDDVQRMTQAVFDIFDEAVRKHPEQWFWYNKHWVLEPVRPRAEAARKGGEG